MSHASRTAGRQAVFVPTQNQSKTYCCSHHSKASSNKLAIYELLDPIEGQTPSSSDRDGQRYIPRRGHPESENSSSRSNCNDCESVSPHTSEDAFRVVTVMPVNPGFQPPCPSISVRDTDYRCTAGTPPKSGSYTRIDHVGTHHDHHRDSMSMPGSAEHGKCQEFYEWQRAKRALAQGREEMPVGK